MTDDVSGILFPGRGKWWEIRDHPIGIRMINVNSLAEIMIEFKRLEKKKVKF